MSPTCISITIHTSLYSMLTVWRGQPGDVMPWKAVCYVAAVSSACQSCDADVWQSAVTAQVFVKYVVWWHKGKGLTKVLLWCHSMRSQMTSWDELIVVMEASWWTRGSKACMTYTIIAPCNCMSPPSLSIHAVTSLMSLYLQNKGKLSYSILETASIFTTNGYYSIIL